MVELELQKLKDLGLNRQVLDALPTAVVGGAYEGSIWATIATGGFLVLLNHIVPAGQQLKLMFLRIETTNQNGARFAIVQTNPTAIGQTGAIEAFPVNGAVPSGVRDYPMLEAAGAEVLVSSNGLRDPIHVFEGSIDFRLQGFLVGPGTNRYGLVWWGVEETPEG